MISIDNPIRLDKGADNDYTMELNSSAWITVGNRSIRIVNEDGTLAIDVTRHGDELGERLLDFILTPDSKVTCMVDTTVDQ